jgi:hypothetical protein
LHYPDKDRLAPFAALADIDNWITSAVASFRYKASLISRLKSSGLWRQAGNSWVECEGISPRTYIQGNRGTFSN